jgi:hypothetical protein
MSTHRHFGLTPRPDADLPEGHPSLNRNGARVGLTDRTALPLSLAPRHDVDMTSEGLPPWFGSAEPLTDEDRGRLLIGAARLSPPILIAPRSLTYMVAAFVLAGIAVGLLALWVYVHAHHSPPAPALLAKGDRLTVAGVRQ